MSEILHLVVEASPNSISEGTDVPDVPLACRSHHATWFSSKDMTSTRKLPTDRADSRRLVVPWNMGSCAVRCTSLFVFVCSGQATIENAMPTSVPALDQTPGRILSDSNTIFLSCTLPNSLWCVATLSCRPLYSDMPCNTLAPLPKHS